MDKNNIDDADINKPFELKICEGKKTDECNEKSCKSRKENSVDEELILPAVAAPLVFPSPNEEPEENPGWLQLNESDIENLMKKIKRKKGCTTRFIEFPNGGLICGSLSKESKQFNKFTREYHSGAMCMVSMAMCSFKDLDCWSGDTIDNVLVSGNSLYIESSVANGLKELDMSMLITSLNIGGSEITMKIAPLTQIPVELLEFKLLSVTLCEMFSNHRNCYLCRGLECWAIFKRGKEFYVFDPLGIQVKEKKCVQRHAVLYKFESLFFLAEHLMKTMTGIFPDECVATCKIGAIFCCPTKVCGKKIDKPVIKITPKKKKINKYRKMIPSISKLSMRLKDIKPICKEENEDKFEDCNDYTASLVQN